MGPGIKITHVLCRCKIVMYLGTCFIRRLYVQVYSLDLSSWNNSTREAYNNLTSAKSFLSLWLMSCL